MSRVLLAALLFQAVGAPPQAQTWTISGRLSNVDSTPAAKSFVGVMAVGDVPSGPYSPLLASAETDGQGNYRLRGLPAGKYKVMAGILDSGSATYFPGVPEPGEANTVVLTGANDLDHVDFSIVRPETLEIDGRTITEVLKRIELRHPSREAKTRIITALRTRLNARYISQSANAILLRDTPARVAFGVQLINDFDNTTSGESTEPMTARLSAPSNVFASGVGFDAAHNVYALEPNTLRDMNPTRSQLQPSATVSLKVTDSARAVFEAVAAKTDLNVAFDSRLQTASPLEVAFDGVDVRVALDLLARRTGSYWQVLDSRTFFVAPDMTSVHQTMDTQVFRTFYLNNGGSTELLEIVVALRTLLNLRYVATIPAIFAISIRDTPGMVALAEKIIGDMDVASTQPGSVASPRTPLPPSTAVMLDASGNLSEMDSSGILINVTPARSRLQVTPAVPVSIDTTSDGQTLFKMIAEAGGLHVQFDPAFESQPVRFVVRNVDLFSALDLLALQTRSRWQVSATHTVVVIPNTPEKLQTLQPKIQTTLYFTNLRDDAAMNSILVAIRTLLNTRESRFDSSAHALMLTDIPTMLELARKIVVDLDRPAR